MSKVVSVDFDRVLDEIQDLQMSSQDGFTIYEMAEHIGHSERWCREKIKELIRREKAKFNGRAQRVRIDGVAYMAPVYLLIK